MASETETRKRLPLLRVAGTLLALALLVYLLSMQGWEEIATAMSEIEPWRLWLAFFLMVVSRFAVSGRWYSLLRASGLPISLWESLRLTFAGLFATNFLPTTIGGDMVRLAGGMQMRLDTAICAASLIVDRLVGMAGMAMVLPFGAPAFAQSGILLGETVASVTVASQGFMRLLERIRRLLLRVSSSLALWLRKPGSLVLALVFTWVHMLCVFTMFRLFFQGMGHEISLLLIAGLYSAVYFITLLPISINGYGVQEVSLTFIFAHLGGVSISSALSAALLFRTMMMLASLPGAAFLPGLVPSRKPHES